MTTRKIEYIARRRAGAKYGFYIHAFVFCTVMLGLFTLNYLTSAHPWSLAPFLGWGLGLCIHGFVVFSRIGGAGLKQRLVQKEIEKLMKKA
jgi:hypothetical protein